MSILLTESILRYLYNEMSSEESAQFLSLIENNPTMMEQFLQMKEGLEVLNKINFSPSTSSTDRIMSYGSMDGHSMQ